MYWADVIAQKIKKRKLPLEWVDDMKTPSGRIHVGSLRGVIVHDLIYKALKDAGVNAKYTYVFENHDPMDDIPSYLPKEKFEPYLGMPLFKIPSPVEGYANYAEYYAKEFQAVFNAIGSYPEILWTKDIYTSGKMNPIIKEILDNSAEIREIYEEMYKKKISSNWFPFQVYCPNCGKVSTTAVSDWDGQLVTYKCEIDKVKWTKGCGSSGKISPFSNKEGMNGKLPWKVEWPAKWKALGITVEGAGKDHMSAGGSHDLAVQICNRIIHYPVPYPIPYEWLLIGGRKMSSSKGVGTSASEILELIPPTLVRFLMVRNKINQQINFDPSGDTIPKLFDDYQKAADAYYSSKDGSASGGNKTDNELARVFELSQVDGIKKPSVVRFSTITQWVQMPNMEAKITSEGLSEWAKYAKIWVERYAPESEKFLVSESLPESAKELTDTQKEYLKKILQEIDKKWTAEELHLKLYELSKEMELSSKDAFSAIYKVLIGKDHGPKAAWLLTSLDKQFIKKRLKEV